VLICCVHFRGERVDHVEAVVHVGEVRQTVVLLEFVQLAELSLMQDRSPDVPVQGFWNIDFDELYSVLAVTGGDFIAAPKLTKKPFTARHRINHPYIARYCAAK